MKLMHNNIRGCELRSASGSPLLAGLNWNNETNSGSQSRNANNYRWNTNSNISTRFLVDPGTVKFLTPVEKLVEQLLGWNSIAFSSQGMSKIHNRRKKQVSSG